MGAVPFVLVSLAVLLMVAAPPGISGALLVPSADGTAAGGAVSVAGSGPASASWPTFLHDAARSGANLAESTIGPTNASRLTTLWSFATTGGVTDSAAVVNGTAYFGAWDGNLYAVNAGTGQLDWKTSLGGPYDYPDCHQPGIAASPTVWNNTVYIGGSDPREYAVNASTGKVLWYVDLANISGSSTPWTAYKAWSSALIVNGSLYVGTSSGCDNPLVRASLLQIDLKTHAVEHVAFTVPSGDTGDSIWSSPSYDPGTNTVWATTGNGLSDRETYARAIMAFNASNVSDVIGYAQEAAPYLDNDFGDGATIFHDASGTPMVVALNKNGVAYAFNISTFHGNVSRDPAWTTLITTEPGASYSPPAFDGSMLYFGSDNTTLANGTAAAGTVRAVYPGNGTTKWVVETPLSVWGGLTYANGLIVAGLTNGSYDASRGGLLILNASSGQTVSYRSTAAIWGESVVLNGELLYPSGNLSSDGGGSLTALALPLAGSLSTSPIPGAPETAYELRVAPTGGVLPYQATWSFGDGTGAFGLRTSHAYDRAGRFDASVVVRDASGQILTFNLSLNSSTPPPAPGGGGVTPGLELVLVVGTATISAVALVAYVSMRRRRPRMGSGQSPIGSTGRPGVP
jgi:outer membrane protein assembly factor BamB